MEENCKYCLMNCPNAGQEGKDETDICENYWAAIIPTDHFRDDPKMQEEVNTDVK